MRVPQEQRGSRGTMKYKALVREEAAEHAARQVGSHDWRNVCYTL